MDCLKNYSFLFFFGGGGRGNFVVFLLITPKKMVGDVRVVYIS